MQICIHWKDNSPKPVNHRLTLKEGPKVKSDIKRLPAHNILQVGFTLQTSRINNKLEDRSQKKKIMFLHSKNKASRKGYKGEC